MYDDSSKSPMPRLLPLLVCCLFWSLPFMGNVTVAEGAALSERSRGSGGSGGLSGGTSLDGASRPAGGGAPAYQRYPAQTTVPTPSTPPAAPKGETRGKYSNPYDRSIPLQGDTHKGYTPARRDPFKR